MNIRVEDNPTISSSLTDAPSQGVPWVDRATLVFIRVLCMAGLFIANYYSWSMTVTGFVNTQLLPDNSVVGNNYLPHLVAGFVQLGILSFYLVIPFMQRRFIIVNSVAFVFAIGLITLSAVFALFSITMNSQSQNIVAYQARMIDGINKKILGVDDLITTTFRAFLTEQDVLSKRACDGKDRTGVPICGPISKAYINRSNAMRDRYSSQLDVAISYANLNSSDFADSLTSLRGNFLKLSQKVGVYHDFSVETGISSTAVNDAFSNINNEIDGLTRRLGEKNPDAKSLVLERVLGDVGRVLTATASASTLFALAVALLPDILSITFTTILIIARTANQEAVVIRRAVRHARQEAEWYDKYAVATEALHRAKQRWRDRRRMASVAEAVDQSVPDTVT